MTIQEILDYSRRLGLYTIELPTLYAVTADPHGIKTNLFVYSTDTGRIFFIFDRDYMDLNNVTEKLFLEKYNEYQLHLKQYEIDLRKMKMNKDFM